MGQMIELKAKDGKTISAYRAEAVGKPRGGLVVIQEIWGVNRHIRSVADGYAADAKGIDSLVMPNAVEAKHPRAASREVEEGGAADAAGAEDDGVVGVVHAYLSRSTSCSASFDGGLMTKASAPSSWNSRLRSAELVPTIVTSGRRSRIFRTASLRSVPSVP